MLFDLKDKMYNLKREEIEYVLERCTECLFRTQMTIRQVARVITSSRVGERYQTDLIDLRYYVSANNRKGWLLNVIDVYSKFLISSPLINKISSEVTRGFKQIFIWRAE